MDLAIDARLVEKPNLAVVYEEGDTAEMSVSSDLHGADLVGCKLNNGLGAELGSGGNRQFSDGGGEKYGVDRGSGADVEGRGARSSSGEGPGVVGAYVIMRGSVDLYVLER